MLVVGSPNVVSESRFKERVDKILFSKQFTNNGPMVQELEEKICEYLNVSHCIAVSNATVGLELTIKAIKELVPWIKKVQIPSYSFIATAHSCFREGLEIEFGDIGSDFILPYDTSSRFDLQIPVDLYGGSCNYDYAWDTCMYDSAHAFGVKYKGERVGKWGLAQIFSLHATKFFQSFEGGLITTKTAPLAKLVREMRNFGYEYPGNSIHGSIKGWGTNAKMSEIHAAMALTNLEGIHILLEKNRENYEEYKKHLPDFCKLIQFPDYVEPNYQYIVITVNNRDEIIDKLYEKGIVARKYFHELAHHLPMYPDADLPNTEKAAKTTLILPTGMNISKKDIKYICNSIYI
jgi:dTDP-4-amino-4,6-dideoxygalactose transaminase